MFATRVTAGYAGPAEIIGPIRRALRRIGGALHSEYRRRRAIAALHGLSDRTLQDIGIARSEIEAMVNAHFRAASRSLR